MSRVSHYENVESKELTPREKEVLIWTARGELVAGVADILCLSVATVKQHLRSISNKLATCNKLEAVYRAVGCRMLKVGDIWENLNEQT